LIEVHNRLDDRLEHALVRLIRDAVSQREVDCVVLTIANTNIAELTSTREVFAVLVEGDGHDAVGSVEGFFDAVAVVDIDVDVEDALLVAEQFDDTKYNVCRNLASVSDHYFQRTGPEPTIHITETTSFTLLGVMETTSPIYRDIAFASIESRSAFHGSTSTDSTELEQPIKYGTIISDIVFALLLAEGIHVLGGDLVQEIDIFVCVELGHFVLGSWFRALEMH